MTEYVQSESLRKHCLAVEAAMRAYARKFNEDEERWAVCGLLHDFDYEKFPTKERHPFEGNKILVERGYPKDITDAIMGHASYSNVLRESQMAKCLYASDELSGFIMAMGYVRPDHLASITPEAVEKSLKKKGFAAKVDREEIEKGIAELGLPREEHIMTVVGALQSVSKELGF